MPIARARGAIASVALAVAVLTGLTTPVGAVEPIDMRDDVAATRTPRPSTTGPRVAPQRPAPRRPAARVPRQAPSVAPTPSPTATPTPTPVPTPTPEPAPDHGFDVSWPQCGDALPEAFAFAIVGVNGGRVYTENPCLGPDGEQKGQLVWAGREVELYANTGNPGPRDSGHWPDGQEEPRPCGDAGADSNPDSADCAYVYGWNAAADSYRSAVEGFVAAGWADPGAPRLPWPTTWWLDVETANSWRMDWRLNVAALQGARDYLESVDVASVGFYSTPLMWWRITGGTDAFAEHPAWHAGADSLEDARRRCETDEAFTGGELVMVQWLEDGLDHDLRCP